MHGMLATRDALKMSTLLMIGEADTTAIGSDLVIRQALLGALLR
jgi:hypothetical protein